MLAMKQLQCCVKLLLYWVLSPLEASKPTAATLKLQPFVGDGDGLPGKAACSGCEEWCHPGLLVSVTFYCSPGTI